MRSDTSLEMKCPRCGYWVLNRDDSKANTLVCPSCRYQWEYRPGNALERFAKKKQGQTALTFLGLPLTLFVEKGGAPRFLISCGAGLIALLFCRSLYMGGDISYWASYALPLALLIFTYAVLGGWSGSQRILYLFDLTGGKRPTAPFFIRATRYTVINAGIFALFVAMLFLGLHQLIIFIFYVSYLFFPSFSFSKRETYVLAFIISTPCVMLYIVGCIKWINRNRKGWENFK